MFTFKLECEIVCQMPALVVSSKQPQSIRIPYLKRPEVQDALLNVSAWLLLDKADGALEQ